MCSSERGVAMKRSILQMTWIMSNLKLAAFSRQLVLGAAAVLLFGIAVAQNCQAQSSTDNHTSAAIAPGSPVGSYSLSGFDTVNLYNGNLNVSLPIYKVGGRGEVGYNIALNIDRRWQVRAWQDYSGPGGSSTGYPTYKPEPNLWDGIKPGFSPGVLQGRPARDRSPSPNIGGYPTNSDCSTLTRLTFTGSDGTEYELRDTQTDGQEHQYTTTYSRGTIFADRTTSELIFVSDTAISDISCLDTSYDVVNGLRRIYPSGWLYFSNGTRYRIDNGAVTSMIDRNGNSLTYANGLVTDSIGRQTTLSAYTTQGAMGGTVSYKGTGGQTRTVAVSIGQLSTVLRSGYTIKTYQQLFPELNGASSATFNDNVTTSMTLPDGRQYKFYYNDYGEIARIELPTGGATEYDWGRVTHRNTLMLPVLLGVLAGDLTFIDGSWNEGFTGMAEQVQIGKAKRPIRL